MNNEVAILAKVSELAPNGMREFSDIEAQMILTEPYAYHGYSENRNEKAIKDIFDTVIGLKGRLPDLQSLLDAAWEHNNELLDEMALLGTIEELNSNGIDIFEDIDMAEFDEKLEYHRVGHEELYSYSNAFDEGYEINKYAITNGISYVVEKDSEAFERELCSYDIYADKDLLMNNAQMVMFDEFIEGETFFNYGKFNVHYMGRG